MLDAGNSASDTHDAGNFRAAATRLVRLESLTRPLLPAGIVAGITLFASGRQGVTLSGIQNPALFRGKPLDDFGAKGNRKSTGAQELAKSWGRTNDAC
jgi:hypothetical protein